MATIKEPIRLRKKKIIGGNFSLYLDCYYNGKRSYEFLKLYLIPEKTREDKERNKQTLFIANTIKSQRIIELQNNECGLKKSATNTRFFDFFQALCKKHYSEESKSSYNIYVTCLHHLEKYESNHAITFKHITPQWLEGFQEYMKQQNISQNSRWIYYSKLRVCVNLAFKKGIISKNPLYAIDNVTRVDNQRMYLTLEEIKKLVQTPLKLGRLKDAFLFSCLTGLRKSDIEKLTWGDVFQQDNFTRIIFKQKKTQCQEYLDISEQASLLMGERKDNNVLVFGKVLNNQRTVNKNIKKWVLQAGINKKITFHCARHTFAVLMLDIGTDLYTVSKLLGHTNIETTQIYAKVLDKNKQTAVAHIPSIF